MENVIFKKKGERSEQKKQPKAVETINLTKKHNRIHLFNVFWVRRGTGVSTPHVRTQDATIGSYINFVRSWDASRREHDQIITENGSN
jgi:hypothetical protein